MGGAVLRLILMLCQLACVSTSKKDVYIPVLAPLYEAKNDRYAYKTSMEYAFELVNQREDILADFNLVPEFFDTAANVPTTLNIIMKIMNKENQCTNGSMVPPVIIGPAFSDTTVAVAQVLQYTHKFQFTYAATTPSLDNFPFLVKTVPGTLTFNRGFIALMMKFCWKRFGIFYDFNERGGIFTKNTEDLIRQAKRSNLTVVDVANIIVGSSNNLRTSDEEIHQRLSRLKQADVKIFIAQFGWSGAYRVFCQVYKLGMYGRGYVWIVHPRVDNVKKWMNTPKYYHDASIKTDCTEAQYREVSQRMLVMSEQTIRRDGVTTISKLTSSEYLNYINKHRPSHEVDRGYHNTSWHANGFDVVWTMALVLNHSIPDLKRIGLTLDALGRTDLIKQSEIFQKNVFNVKYEGVAGPVSFRKENNALVVGSLSLKQYREREIVTLGTYHVASSTFDLDSEEIKDMWIDGKVPLDISKSRMVLLNVPLVLYGTMSTIAGLGIVLAIGVLIFNIYNRNERYIRKSAPMFNNVIVIGIILCLSTVPYFGLPITLEEKEKFVWSCKLRSWALCLGFSLSFGSMFVKTWRVYKIFTNRKLKYNIDRLSNTSLFVMIISIVAVDIFILLLWGLLDPLEVETNHFSNKTDPDDENTVLVSVVYTCYSVHQTKWVTTIYVIKGVLLLYGLFLAYETRNVQFDHLNDSRMIGVCVYNVAVMSVLGVLLNIILNETYYKESFGISGVCIIFPSLGTLLLIFLPKSKRLILGLEPTPSVGYSRVVRFVKSNGETENSDVVYEGPVPREAPNNLQLRKDSVDSEGVTSCTSSLPMSSSRIMPIYEEANGTVNDDNEPETDERTTSQSLSSCQEQQ